MEISLERVGGYVRALQASLDALAPNEDHVPLSAARDHLAALDPALSGRLLLPAEISDRTGMPSFTWMQRAISEAVIARRRDDETDTTDLDIERALSLDAELGARMRDRRDLHRHLRRAELLAPTRLVGAVRRIGESTDFAVAYDRMAPDGRWVRIRIEIRAPAPGRRAGPLWVDDKGTLHLRDSLQHLLTRHFATPLLALRGQLVDAVQAEVIRLSRSWVGPFWFPGIALPEAVPEALGTGLLLHASTEVVAHDVRESRHLDPWLGPPAGEQAPEGYGIFRERRFAATGRVLDPARSWAESQGFRNVVVPVGAPRRRRL